MYRGFNKRSAIALWFSILSVFSLNVLTQKGFINLYKENYPKERIIKKDTQPKEKEEPILKENIAELRIGEHKLFAIVFIDDSHVKDIKYKIGSKAWERYRGLPIRIDKNTSIQIKYKDKNERTYKEELLVSSLIDDREPFNPDVVEEDETTFKTPVEKTYKGNTEANKEPETNNTNIKEVELNIDLKEDLKVPDKPNNKEDIIELPISDKDDLEVPDKPNDIKDNIKDNIEDDIEDDIEDIGSNGNEESPENIDNETKEDDEDLGEVF